MIETNVLYSNSREIVIDTLPVEAFHGFMPKKVDTREVLGWGRFDGMKDFYQYEGQGYEFCVPNGTTIEEMIEGLKNI